MVPQTILWVARIQIRAFRHRTTSYMWWFQCKPKCELNFKIHFLVTLAAFPELSSSISLQKVLLDRAGLANALVQGCHLSETLEGLGSFQRLVLCCHSTVIFFTCLSACLSTNSTYEPQSPKTVRIGAVTQTNKADPKSPFGKRLASIPCMEA